MIDDRNSPRPQSASGLDASEAAGTPEPVAASPGDAKAEGQTVPPAAPVAKQAKQRPAAAPAGQGSPNHPGRQNAASGTRDSAVTARKAEANVNPAPSTAPAGGAPAQAGFAAGPIDAITAQEERLFSRLTRITFLLMVAAPVLATAIYLFALASDRYAVEVKFGIRSPNGLPTSDLIGMVTGGAAGATQSDSYMVVEYLQSRQFLDELSARVSLQDVYSVEDADYLMRLDPEATKEDQVDYLTSVIRPTYDSTAQIITVEVQAFRPEDARLVAENVLAATGDMVNRLSEQARRDTVRLAEAEVARAEETLRSQRAAIAAFREESQKIDPKQSVAAQETLLGNLQGNLASARTELQSLRTFLAPDAPSIKVVESRIASLESQIAAERASLGRGDSGTSATQGDGTTENLNEAVSLYEALAVDLEFHQRTYVSALASLEAARVEADRQQRYLASVVFPALPQEAIYPRQWLTLSLVAAICFLIWGVATMFIHVVREHLR